VRAPAERNDELEALLDYIKRERGFDFTGYKRPSLTRRIDKRIQEAGCPGYVEYLSLLEAEPQEFAELFNTILINVTSFFRDAETWAYVREEIVPRLLETKAPDEPVRAWSTGCASGEEAYTVAIVLAEALGENEFRDRAKIYGTDVDEQALTSARAGTFRAEQLDPVPTDLREKYFEAADSDRMMVRPDLRRAVIFGRHDLIQDPPISRIDLLLARNTLIYFSTKSQEAIVENFQFSLNDTGYLLLGRSEAVAGRSKLFEPVDLKRRVFAPLPRSGDFRNRLLTLMRDTDDGDTSPAHLTERLRETGFELSPVAQVVVQRDGRLAFANGRARSLFRLTARDLRRPFSELEISYRPVELRSLIDRAYETKAPATLEEVPLADGGETYFYEVQVVPMIGVDGVVGTSITFNDVTRYKRMQEAAEGAQTQLATAFETEQSSAEELETTNEELQSTNEELETTNEELQSTNEELETLNEELQATNEELETLNEELRRRTYDLDRANQVMEGVLEQVRVAIVVVDPELQIEAWSERAEQLWGLSAERVIGKNLLALDIGFPVAELKEPVRGCLAGTADGFELEVEAVNRLGERIRCRVTCAALRDGRSVRGAMVVMEERPGADT